MTRYSLERSIRNGLILLMLPAFLMIIVLATSAVKALSDQSVTVRLKQDAETLITSLKGGDNQQAFDASKISPAYHRVRSGRYFIILYPDTELRSRSLWDWQLDVERLRPGQSLNFREDDYGNQTWLVWQQGIHFNGTDITLWVAEDITHFDAQIERYSYYLSGFLLLLMLLVLYLQRRILTRGFATLKPLQESLKDGHIHDAVGIQKALPEEVQPLADTILKLVKHSGEQLNRSRMATGNLAHELKLPLQQLQMLADDTTRPDSHQIKEVYLQLRQRIDKELRRAKISGSPAPGELFSPSEELPYLERLLNLSRKAPLTAEFHLPQEAMPFDRDDMLELIGNLLDNAWRYASSRIDLSIKHQEHCWIIAISDDGPGIPAPQRPQVLERGFRNDEQSENNHGLGLSICKSVVESYNGSISLGESESGGLLVEIRLPQSEGGCSAER